MCCVNENEDFCDFLVNCIFVRFNCIKEKKESEQSNGRRKRNKIKKEKIFLLNISSGHELHRLDILVKSVFSFLNKKRTLQDLDQTPITKPIDFKKFSSPAGCLQVDIVSLKGFERCPFTNTRGSLTKYSGGFLRTSSAFLEGVCVWDTTIYLFRHSGDLRLNLYRKLGSD